MSTEIKTPGQKLKDLLREAQITQEELAEQVERTPNYISMIICGKRNLTPALASKIVELEVFKKKGVRKEYLLGFDEFKTDKERASAIIKKSVNRRTCVEQLIVLHGYSIEELTTPDGKIRIALTAPSGNIRYFTGKEYLSFLNSLDDVFESQLMFQFRQLTDGTKEYWR